MSTIHLRHVRYVDLPEGKTAFPFDLPILRELEGLDFGASVTILVGENGTGKSTFLEALAAACGSVVAGGEDIRRDPSLAHARALAEHFKLVWNKRTSRGFFLRAEDFFRYVRRLQKEKQELQAMADHFDRSLSGYGRMLAQGSAMGQKKALESRYGGDLDACSHGESFLTFFQSRLVPGGLFLLDEPEAALSPQRQLSLVALIKDMVEEGGQFVIATHAPVLMAVPGARILSLDERPPCEVAYEDLEHVRFLRDFLASPERFLRHL